MRRWHNEVSLMDRQRRMDLADHRRFAMKMHWRDGELRLPDPNDFECECKKGKGMFRKHKQWSCSCHRCRAEGWFKRYERKVARKRDRVTFAG